MADPVLEVREVSVEYDGTPVLRGVDLTVASGEVVALLGPSGSGKTTLLHVVAGFRPPSAGEIRLRGSLVASPTRFEPPEQRNVAVVFQNYALWPHLSAVDTVAYPARRRGVGKAQARVEALDVLERLHIGQLAARRPAELSGGEQQRVGLARALARRASLYLFDEPTAHLDTSVRGVFLAELVTRQRDSGAAALYATHDAEEALGLADRVVLLSSGRVVQVGTPAQVYAEPVDLWAARLTGPASLLTVPDGGQVLVRPEWASLGGEREGKLRSVAFAGPHSDYLVETGDGDVLLRETGTPRAAAGEQVSWTLHRSWPLQAPGEPG